MLTSPPPTRQSTPTPHLPDLHVRHSLPKQQQTNKQTNKQTTWVPAWATNTFICLTHFTHFLTNYKTVWLSFPKVYSLYRTSWIWKLHLVYTCFAGPCTCTCISYTCSLLHCRGPPYTSYQSYHVGYIFTPACNQVHSALLPYRCTKLSNKVQSLAERISEKTSMALLIWVHFLFSTVPLISFGGTNMSDNSGKRTSKWGDIWLNKPLSTSSCQMQRITHTYLTGKTIIPSLS